MKAPGLFSECRGNLLFLQGRHAELLAQKGKYHELYMTQFAGITT